MPQITIMIAPIKGRESELWLKTQTTGVNPASRSPLKARAASSRPSEVLKRISRPLRQEKM